MPVPPPWERLLWSGRARLAPWLRYTLSGLRLVRQAGSRSDELAIHDIGEVRSRRSWLDRLLGTSTLVIHPRDRQRTPLVLARVSHGDQLAALLELLSGHPGASWAPDSPGATDRHPAATVTAAGQTLLGLGAIAVAVVVVAVSVHGRAAAITYPPDDPIAPGGVKKNRAEIVRFMEAEVMPWARRALAPLAGGPDAVTCETCHGQETAAPKWQMPAVVMLPRPEVIVGGWEVYGGTMDAQMRNAIYGYVAESDTQAKATYMRKIVMPGMARLLHRPAYDFTRSYDYNRSRLAFGCYHCHKVK